MDAAAAAAGARLREIVTAIRTIRATYEVEPKRRIDVVMVAPQDADRAFVEGQRDLVMALARLARLDVVPSAEERSQTIKQPVGGVELQIPMAGLFDIAAEKTRLTKERLKIDQELEGLRKRLENPQFVSRAKPEVVLKSRERVAELEARRETVEQTVRSLGGVG